MRKRGRDTNVDYTPYLYDNAVAYLPCNVYFVNGVNRSFLVAAKTRKSALSVVPRDVVIHGDQGAVIQLPPRMLNEACSGLTRVDHEAYSNPMLLRDYLMLLNDIPCIIKDICLSIAKSYLTSLWRDPIPRCLDQETGIRHLPVLAQDIEIHLIQAQAGNYHVTTPI